MSGPEPWEVRLPEGAVRTRGRAHVLLRFPEGGEEDVAVPVSVGRRLAAEGRVPSCRAEALALVRSVEEACARERVEELLGRRDYASRELAERLGRDGFSVEVVRERVGRAVASGLVDDARYAGAFARAKVLAGWGRLRIERELERRGVSPRDLPGWPEEFLGEGDERERALTAASRRRLTGRNDVARIARFLAGRGFAPSLALDVAREVAGAGAPDDA